MALELIDLHETPRFLDLNTALIFRPIYRFLPFIDKDTHRMLHRIRNLYSEGPS